MRSGHLSIWIFFLFFLSGTSGICGTLGSENQILVISSYSPLRENGTQTIASFSQKLGEKGKYRIMAEYLDCESAPDFSSWKEWMNQLFTAFPKTPQAVVLLGGEAWAAYKATCPPDWKAVPIVLGNVKKGELNYEDRQSEISMGAMDMRPIAETFDDFPVTGYYVEDYFDKDLQLIRRLQPEVLHIVFLYDDRYSIDFFRDYLNKKVTDAGFEDMIYLSGRELSTAQVLDTISGMDETYALFSAGWYTDSIHYTHAYSMLNNELSWDLSKFIYMVMDLGFTNANELGGYYVSGREMGADLAGLTYQVLTQGVENSPEFGPTPSNPQYHINYRTLVDAGIDPARVPSDTVFYKREPSIFREYLWETVMVTLLFLALVAILILVFFHRRRQEKIYRKANDKMKHLVEMMPNMAVIFDRKLHIQEIINPREDMETGNLVGKHVDELEGILHSSPEEGRKMAENIRQTASTGGICSFHYKVEGKRGVTYLDARSAPYEDGVICFVHDATAHIAAKKEVSRLQTFLQSIVDNLPVGLHVKNASDEFRYVLCNEKSHDFYSSSNHRLQVGKNDFETGASLAEEYRADDLKTLESDEALTFDRFLYDDKGNLVRSGMATKSKLVNNDGSCYIITVLVDLTLDREKERELYNAKQKLSIAMDAGSLAAWNYNPEKNWFASLHSQTISGDGFHLEDAYQRVHPDDLPKFKAMMEGLIRGEKENTKEILRFDQQGQYEWFEIYATVIKDPFGRTEQIIGTEKNITHRVEDEHKLHEYAFKFDMVRRSGGFVQWDYDVPSRTFSSPDPQSFLHQGLSLEKFMMVIHPQDASLLLHGLEQLSEGNVDTLTLEARANLTGSGYRWVEMYGVVFARDEHGRVITVSGLRRDISEMKKINEELVVLRDKAEESSRLKSAFLANMSHEIRTPLNAIVGFSNLIAETEDKEQIREYYNIVQTNNELLLQLINDILDLSKIESGQLEFVYTDVDICTVFRQLEQVYRQRIRPEVDLICELPDESCIIHSEKNRLTQVLSNFLSNASKYTSKGSVRMGYKHIGKELYFYVTDTGKGISRENQARVFERFVKCDAFVQGTGLGLSICDVIVKYLDGKIGVESEEGKGSTFWFTIPAVPLSERDTDIPSFENRPDQPVKEPMKMHGKSILGAEDNDSNYLLLSTILKKEYHLTRAVNGAEAVRLYHEIKPDLILMDIKMPVMTGLEATAEIRKSDKNIPIIALTAYAFGSDRDEAINAGCDRVMTKPINIKEIKDVLSKLLGD